MLPAMCIILNGILFLFLPKKLLYRKWIFFGNINAVNNYYERILNLILQIYSVIKLIYKITTTTMTPLENNVSVSYLIYKRSYILIYIFYNNLIADKN